MYVGSQKYYYKNYQFKIAITHKNTNIYIENPFSLKEKITGQTPNQFTIYQINYNNACVCFMIKEKSLLFFFTTHTLIISLKSSNTLLFPFYFLLHAQLSLGCLLFSKQLTLGCSLSLFFLVQLLSLLLHILLLCLLEGGSPLLSPSSCVPPKQKSLLFSLDFMLYFSSLQREYHWAKANKFFVALSIYKTFFLFFFELGIHYFFNKE